MGEFMSGVSINIAKGLSYNKTDGVLLNWDQTTSKVIIFHRRDIGSIETYNNIKTHTNLINKSSTPFGILFKNKSGGVILQLPLDNEKELQPAITKLVDPEMNLFKDHMSIQKEDVLCLSETLNKLLP